MENKQKVSGGKAKQYYGVSSAEVDMFMSRARDYGAVTYLAYAKGIHSIEKNTTSHPIGEDHKTKTNQSSTGNIYGIYDLNGGQTEFVSFYLNTDQAVLENQGKILKEAAGKYKDAIMISQSVSIAEKLRLYKGIAMSETSGFSSVSAVLPTENLPFLVRNNMFDFAGNSGQAAANTTFRITLINK
jgi:hypothetical protein